MDLIQRISDDMQVFFARRKRANTLSDALKRIVSPRLVQEIESKVPTEALIESIAYELEISAHELLREVAKVMNLGHSTSLVIPNERLLLETSFSASEFESFCALPLPSLNFRAPYQLVVADPSVIDLELFQAGGVRVMLGLGSEILDTWQRFHWSQEKHGIEISDSQTFSIVRRLAEDAVRLRASEVFVGHPSPDSYEFLAGGDKYQGKLHPEIYPKLLDMFVEETRLLIPCPSSSPCSSLSVALTRNFERPILCLTWDLREVVAEESDSSARENVSKAVEPTVERIQKKNDLISTGVKTEPCPARKRVMLVDDDEKFLVILTKILEEKGWEVSFELNGQLALEAISREEFIPDLIISDVHMPQMDGSGFLKELKARGLSTPVLMLTSDSDELLEAELALLGADAFVRKQEDPRVLLAWCKNLLERAREYKSVADISLNGAHKIHANEGSSARAEG